MPFVYAQKFYAVRWVVNSFGSTEVHEFDVHDVDSPTEMLQGKTSRRKHLNSTRAWYTDGIWLQDHFLGKEVLGGTPFVLFNSSHYIGIGHVKRHLYNTKTYKTYNYRMFFMLLALETFNIAAITDSFYVRDDKTVAFDENAYTINFPMSVDIRDGPALVARASIGIWDVKTVVVEVPLRSFKWFTENGESFL